jgi:hypothetical protein
VRFSLTPGDLLWTLPLLVAAVALALWAYRFVLPPLAPTTRRLLFLLRALALAALVFLLARPIFSSPEAGGGREVVVLEDRSLSMDLPSSEAKRTRTDIAHHAADDVARRLAGRYHVRRYVFAAEARTAESDSAGRLDRASTALGDAIASLSGREGLAGVVVVSDGAANRGRDPVQSARELGRPVSTVAIEGPRGWNASLEEVMVNPTARAGQPTPIAVRLRNAGSGSRRASVTVTEGSDILSRRDVTLPPNGEETVEEMAIVPRRPGLAFYRVQLDAGPGETMEADNRRSAVQTVTPDRQRVLVLVPGPNWDWTWLKRAVDGDSSWAAEHAQIKPGGWAPMPSIPAKNAPPAGAALTRYAVVVAQGLSGPDANGPLGTRLAEYVRNGGGLVLWGGDGAGGAALAGLRGSALAREVGLDVGSAATDFSADPPSGSLPDLIRVEEDAELVRRFFAGAPPITGVSPVNPRPGDQVVLTAASGRVPLLLLRRVGRGRVLFINGSGLWRWGFSAADEAAAPRFDRLWGNALRLLSEPTQSEPLRVAADQALVSRGEPIEVSASLQDSRFQPVDGASVTASLERESDLPGGARGGATAGAQGTLPGPVRLTGQGGGTYAGRWESLPPGRYRLRASSVGPGGARANASSEFVVDEWSPEYLASESDTRTLERMAQVSGGVSGTPDKLGSLAGKISSSAASSGKLREHRLWESPLFYLLSVGMLSGEWFLRRKRGLP